MTQANMYLLTSHNLQLTYHELHWAPSQNGSHHYKGHQRLEEDQKRSIRRLVHGGHACLLDNLPTRQLTNSTTYY